MHSRKTLKIRLTFHHLHLSRKIAGQGTIELQEWSWHRCFRCCSYEHCCQSYSSLPLTFLSPKRLEGLLKCAGGCDVGDVVPGSCRRLQPTSVWLPRKQGKYTTETSTDPSDPHQQQLELSGEFDFAHCRRCQLIEHVWFCLLHWNLQMLVPCSFQQYQHRYHR